MPPDRPKVTQILDILGISRFRLCTQWSPCPNLLRDYSSPSNHSESWKNNFWTLSGLFPQKNHGLKGRDHSGLNEFLVWQVEKLWSGIWKIHYHFVPSRRFHPMIFGQSFYLWCFWVLETFRKHHAPPPTLWGSRTRRLKPGFIKISRICVTL